MNQIKTVGIIGASGFVGTRLLSKIAGKYNCRALTRSKPKNLLEKIQWCPLNLFSYRSTFDALSGVETAIYLVHSMMPSSRLFQGDFHDTDLLLADNFARACIANKVKHIIYLSGVMPEGYVSPHLNSRHEVEDVFKATGIPTTVLRAGMIVGPGGSSFEILKTLVQRLPFMILPAWTKRATQAIFIDDVVSVISDSIEDDSFKSNTFDVVNGEKLTYAMLLHQMADVLKLRKIMIPVPIQSTSFSKLWVQIFGNSTRELVSPLIDSLLCDLPQVPPSPIILSRIHYRTFESMARESIKRDGGKIAEKPKRTLVHEKSVRSIQRLVGLPQHHSHWIAEEYMNFLSHFSRFLIRVIKSEDQKTISFLPPVFTFPLLVLQYRPGEFEADRQKFFIVGGLLTKTTDTGWLEFRQVCDKKYTLAAIHEFVPSLPWPIYRLFQANIHKYVMAAFNQHLISLNLTHS